MIRKYFCIFTKGIGLNVSYQYKYNFIGTKNNIYNFNSILEKIKEIDFVNIFNDIKQILKFSKKILKTAKPN